MVRRTLWSVVVCIYATPLGACALKYVEPVGNDSAQLQIDSNAPLALNFYRDATACTDTLQVPRTPAMTYRIPGNKEFALRFFYFQGNYISWTACDENIISFNAEAGHYYVLHYSRENGACHWALMENSGGREVPVHSWKRERDPTVTSMGGEGTWCKPRAR